MAQSLPKTYKAAVFESKGAPLVIKDLPLELPKAGEVLVKVLASGVCHSDVMVQNGGMGSSFPIIPGHEAIGDVAAVGPNETLWKVGDRVGAAWHGGHDGTCTACRRGMFQMCENETINGVYRDGSYAEYVILRREAVVSVPKDVDPAEYAPFLCAGVTTFNSMRRMGIHPGQVVAIQGLGGLGHLAVQFAAKMGFRVVALSSGAGKEAFARDFGATDYVDTSSEDPVARLQSMGGAALIVATAPSPQAIAPLTGGLQAGGKLMILAACGDVPINTGHLILKGVSVHGWPSGASLDCEETITFARQQNVRCLIEKFPLQDAQKAYEHMVSGKARFRAVLTVD
ncbi:MAG: hypothetical protein M1839_004074 [Geoglossum umbratile]|nr:MAG: hypothetical protein M1839_004074 [Geoglossum umbratile]